MAGRPTAADPRIVTCDPVAGYPPRIGRYVAQLAEVRGDIEKIEGRQRSPAYVAQVTRVWREAIDNCRASRQRYSVKPAWMTELNKVAEGQQHTLGAYHRKWK